jgi:biopolymer transport protein ExbD
LVISVSADDSVGVNDRHDLSPAELEKILAGWVAANPHLVVTIATDREASYAKAREILEVCARVKIQDVTFTVMDESPGQDTELPGQ